MDLKLDISSICVSCDFCRFICPEDAILTDGKLYLVEQWSCTLCHNCIEICPTNAIRIVQTDIVE